MVDPLWGSTAEAMRELIAQKVLSLLQHTTTHSPHHISLPRNPQMLKLSWLWHQPRFYPHS